MIGSYVQYMTYSNRGLWGGLGAAGAHAKLRGVSSLQGRVERVPARMAASIVASSAFKGAETSDSRPPGPTTMQPLRAMAAAARKGTSSGHTRTRRADAKVSARINPLYLDDTPFGA